jgi:hypothetical protein
MWNLADIAGFNLPSVASSVYVPAVPMERLSNIVNPLIALAVGAKRVEGRRGSNRIRFGALDARQDPWERGDGFVFAPADHGFEFSVLFETAGITMLKVLYQLATELQA